jgi:hypothetical protein
MGKNSLESMEQNSNTHELLLIVNLTIIVVRLMDSIQDSPNNLMHKSKFCELMYKYPALLSPIFTCQKRISNKTLGHRRWKELSDQRTLTNDGEYLTVKEFWSILKPGTYPSTPIITQMPSILKKDSADRADVHLSASERSMRRFMRIGRNRKDKLDVVVKKKGIN